MRAIPPFRISHVKNENIVNPSSRTNVDVTILGLCSSPSITQVLGIFDDHLNRIFVFIVLFLVSIAPIAFHAAPLSGFGQSRIFNAIVMTRDALRAIALPKLRVDDARKWLSEDWSIRKRTDHPIKNGRFLEYLAWLWRVCVEDVFDHVSTLCKTTSQDLPRVRWIGCGLASSMPFHAAGLHDYGSREHAFGRVISSYTPSVKALLHARSQTKRTQDHQPTRAKMLITAMPKTPRGANDRMAFSELKGVRKERKQVAKTVKRYMHTDKAVSDIDIVLSRLEECQVAHFACHGISDMADPSNSGLVLQRRAADGTLEQGHLSVYRISHLQLRRAQIAYLSACSTAENKAARLQDEVIHIVSGFQVAGFPHVVGSLWPAGDAECVEVATSFYSSLFSQEGQPRFEGRQVALALQKAVMAVRAADMDMPLNWAQFVHFDA
jgi:hypothetical protein